MSNPTSQLSSVRRVFSLDCATFPLKTTLRKQDGQHQTCLQKKHSQVLADLKISLLVSLSPQRRFTITCEFSRSEIEQLFDF